MAEVYTVPFTVTLSSGYTAGNGTISVSGAAPVAVQTGTFRVRLGNTANTVLKVLSGAATTTWSVVAEYFDGNASSGATVYGCEFTPGGWDQVRADDAGGGGGGVSKFTQSFSGQASPITVTHGLGTLAVIIQTFDGSGLLVDAETITITDSNTVTLTFGSSFTGKVVIVG